MPGVTPPCYNRPPRAEGQWMPTDRLRVNLLVPWPAPLFKPVLRWVPSAFEDRCATHDGRGIGPNGESYPVANGWDCNGCRWDPRELVYRPNPNIDPREQAAKNKLFSDALMAVDKPVHNAEVIPSPTHRLDGYRYLIMEPDEALAAANRRTAALLQPRRAGKTSTFRKIKDRLLSDVLARDLGIAAPWRKPA